MATFMLDVDEEEQARVAAQRARRGRSCIPGGHWPVCELRPSRAMRRRLTHHARAAYGRAAGRCADAGALRAAGGGGGGSGWL